MTNRNKAFFSFLMIAGLLGNAYSQGESTPADFRERASVYGTITEEPPSIPEYFSWINNTNGGAFELFDTDVYTWELNLSKAQRFRYVRIYNAPRRVAELDGWANQTKLDASSWCATNLFAPYRAASPEAAWQATVAIPAIVNDEVWLTWDDVPTLEWRDSWTMELAAPTSTQGREISQNQYTSGSFIPEVSAVTISVDAGQVVKECPPGPASAVLCWLLDSDIHTKRKTSFEDAAKAMKVGSLRFPYGHLADNYLWHTPPYGDVSGGLRHKAATRSQAPANWGWAVDKNNFFTESLDFDEFMGYCIRLNVKPVVSVNVLSYKYSGGPSYDYLKTSAVEWVKYAMKKGYEGIYWQLGNEVEHHQDLLSSSEYINLYEDFASAMKGVNPDSKIGPGILANASYYRGVIDKDPDLVDFVCVHQYNWRLSFNSYDGWKNYTGDFLDNLRKAQKGISEKPELEILVTETDAQSGTKLPGGGHTARSLWWFEQLMNEISFPNVTHTYFWGTHSPWGGQNQNPRSGSLLLDNDNNLTNMGKVNTFVNTHLEGQELVEVERVHGTVRAYATRTPKNDQVTVFLLNKNNVREDNVEIDIHNFKEIAGFTRWEFKGSTWDNYDPTYAENGSIETSGNSFTTSLEPLSVTIITVKAVPWGD